MDHVVRRAVSLGMTPIQAIQSVTLNPAVYSGLEQEIGGIAPGRHADFALLDDLESCRVREVWIGGQLAARDGASMISVRPMDLPDDTMFSLRLGATISPDTFKIRAPAHPPRARVMELLNQTITAERIVQFDAAGGFIEADVARDLLKVAMFDRHHGSAEVALGFLKGFGARVGAVGLTTNLDENTLLIAGSDDADMARCAEVLLQAGGGIAVVHCGDVLERIDFPCGGIFSLLPWKEVGRGLRRIQNRLKEMGSSFDKPIFALSFLPFVTLPALRITARGLIQVKDRRIVPLWVD
jgi:adenine deaminase